MRLSLPKLGRRQIAEVPAGFDWSLYVNLYADLQHLTNAEAATKHYCTWGAQEKRLYSSESVTAFLRDLETEFGSLPPFFVWQEYIANYSDLGHLNNFARAAEHFLRYGRREDRIPFHFDYDTYRSLYFGTAEVPDEVLLEHFLAVGRPAGYASTLAELARQEGLPSWLWLQSLKLDDFNLLNERWAGVSANKREALQAMVREGFSRLAPISLDKEFDPKYYGEANPSISGLDDANRYKHWLFEGMPIERPGTALAHLAMLGLALTAYPDGFDVDAYARAVHLRGIDKWATLDHVIANDELDASAVPVKGPNASIFIVALARAVLARQPTRSVALLERAAGGRSLEVPELETLAEALTALGRWPEAASHFGQVLALGGLEVPIVVKAVQAALKAHRPRDALEFLRLGQGAAAGDVRWRAALRDAIEAGFREAWAQASDLYAEERRAEADQLMTSIVAEVEQWWALDPVGLPLPAEREPRIVLLANVDLRQCTHYRVNQKIEIFEQANLKLQVYTQAQVDDFITALPGASAALFYRLPATPMNVRAISISRALDIPSYYDIDDLIFDPAHYPEPIETYGASVSRSFYFSLQLGVPLFRSAMALCDFGIASTTCLANYMKPVVRSGRCFVLPNGIDSHIECYLDFELPQVRRNDDIVLFYGSGTKAHNSDFLDLLGGPLTTLMDRYPKLRLMIVGYLALDTQFERFRDRIVQVMWTKDVASYWSLLAEADVNLAVLTPSPTTDCKSEIKWLEAAAMGVPSVVSATDRYREVLEDGADALFARHSDEWLDALDKLIRTPALRAAIARTARAKAVKIYGLANNADYLRALLAPALEKATQSSAKPKQQKRILLFNIFFPPQTVGGSTRVTRDNVDSFISSGFAAECSIAVMTSDLDNPNPYQLRVDDYKGMPVFRASTFLEPQQEWRPFNERFGLLFKRVLDLWRPDLVHVHSIQRASASILVECIKKGIPYINTIHDAWWVSDYQFLTEESGKPRAPEEPLPFNPPYSKSVGEALERRRRLRTLLERSAAILGVSDAFTRVMQDAGYPTTRSVPNGVPHMARVMKRPSMTGRVRIVQVSGWTHHKGYHLVQAAFKTGHFDNIELTILDHWRFGGADVHTQWGKTPVTFVGKMKSEDMHLLYANQDVLLAPSVWPESFGLVSREATAAGLWVVASDRGAIGEGIKHGTNGWVIGVSTIRPLLDVLDEINRDARRYQSSPPALPTEARTADDQARDLVKIYREILDRPPDPQTRPYFMDDRLTEDADASEEDRRYLATYASGKLHSL